MAKDPFWAKELDLAEATWRMQKDKARAKRRRRALLIAACVAITALAIVAAVLA
jgi:hypothetical protein